MMKKSITILWIIVISFSLIACNNEKNVENVTDSESTENSVENTETTDSGEKDALVGFWKFESQEVGNKWSIGEIVVFKENTYVTIRPDGKIELPFSVEDNNILFNDENEGKISFTITNENLTITSLTDGSTAKLVRITQEEFLAEEEVIKNERQNIKQVIAFIENEVDANPNFEDTYNTLGDSLLRAYMAIGMKEEANHYALRVLEYFDLSLESAKAEYEEYLYEPFDYNFFLEHMEWLSNLDMNVNIRAYEYLKDTPVGDDFKAILDADKARLNEAATLKLKAKEAAKNYDVIVDDGIYTAFTRFNPKPLSGVGSGENPYIFESEFNVEILLPYYDQLLKSVEFDTLDCDYGRNIWGLDVVGVQTNDGYLIKNHFEPLFINQSYSVGAQNRNNSGTFYREFSGFVYTIKKGEPKANVDYSVELEVLDREYYDGIVYTEDVKILIKLKPSYKEYIAAGKGLPLGVYWMGVHDEIDLMDYLNDKKGPWYGSVYNPTYSEEFGGIVITVDNFVDYISIAGKKLNFTLEK